MRGAVVVLFLALTACASMRGHEESSAGTVMPERLPEITPLTLEQARDNAA